MAKLYDMSAHFESAQIENAFALREKRHDRASESVTPSEIPTELMREYKRQSRRRRALKDPKKRE